MSLVSSNAMVGKLEAIQKSFKEPSFWVRVTGATLAACAGMVNSVAYLSLGAFVSHVTGSLTKVGMAVEGTYQPAIWYQPILLVLCFLLGSVMCGIVVVGPEVQFGKSLYGLVLLVNSALLTATSFLADYDRDVAPYLAAVACGLQNGMCTMHFGAVVRTTHVTGLVTDVGLLIGRIIALYFRRGCRPSQLSILDHTQVEVDLTKLRVLSYLGVGFFGGVIFGSYLNRWMGSYGFLVPASMTGIGGFLCFFFRQRMKTTIKSMKNRVAMGEVQRILRRAQAQVEELKVQAVSFQREATPETGAQIGNMLACMEDMDFKLSGLCQDADDFVPKERHEELDV